MAEPESVKPLVPAYDLVKARSYEEAVRNAPLALGDLGSVICVHAASNSDGTYSVWYDWKPVKEQADDVPDRTAR